MLWEQWLQLAMKLQGLVKPIEVAQATGKPSPAHRALWIQSQGAAVGQMSGPRQISQPKRIALIGEQTMLTRMATRELGIDRCSQQPITSRLMLLGLLERRVVAVIVVRALHLVSPHRRHKDDDDTEQRRTR